MKEVEKQTATKLETDEALQVTVAADTLADASAALARREVFAILGIPKHTEREVLKGNKARLAAYVDSAYFLLYSRTLEGINEAANTVTSAVAAHDSHGHAALTKYSPVELLTEPLFNPTGGYASYVVPAAFVLILQQTLLMGSSMVGGITFEAGGIQARRRRGGAKAVAGQALAHLCLAMPGVALYLIILPRVYGFSTLGHLLDRSFCP
ncbi:MAG: ABC transporter permease [Rhodomicrobium sp.]